MQSPFQLVEVYPPNLLPSVVSTKTMVFLAESHFLWKTSALSESIVALYNKLIIIFLSFLFNLLVINSNSFKL